MNTLAKLLLTVTLAAMLLPACTSVGPRSYPTRALFPETAALSDADIREALDTPLHLWAPVAVSIVWIDDYDPDDVRLPEAERARILADLDEAFSRSPFSRVSIVPSTLESSYSRSSARPGLLEFRSAAARFQSDVVVLINTQMNEYADWNVLGPSYVLVFPMLFVPGDALGVCASAEATAIDVRTGLFLASATGHGRAEQSFGSRLRRVRNLRQLATEAVVNAMKDLPDVLQRRVSERIASAEE